MSTPLFNKVAFIGIGLIGSSIARVMRRDGLAKSIVSCARSDETLKTVLQLSLADEVTKEPAVAAQDADLVMICTPISTYGMIAEAIAPSLKPGAIVTDVGSVKASAVTAIAPHLPKGTHFVPGHPIAGTENSGPKSGFDTLFEGRWFLITPPPGTDQGAIDKVAELWKRAGSNIEFLEPEHHDQVLAITSHLPHLIAYTIVGTAVDLETQLKNDVIRFSASGFRDFTRIASSDPVMWRDVFLNNDVAVLEMLQRFSEDLSYLQRAIRWQEGNKLEKIFARTREIRRSIIDAGQD